MAQVSRSVYGHDWITTFTGAIFAGWLIALMVWLLPASGDLALVTIVILTYVIAIGGFQHSIAGSVEGDVYGSSSKAREPFNENPSTAAECGHCGDGSMYRSLAGSRLRERHLASGKLSD